MTFCFSFRLWNIFPWYLLNILWVLETSISDSRILTGPWNQYYNSRWRRKLKPQLSWRHLLFSVTKRPFHTPQIVLLRYNWPISSVQSLSRVWLSATLWIAARQASLSISNSWSSPKLTSVESVMPSSHLILCRPLLLLTPIPPSIRVFSKWVNSSQVAKVLEFQL